MCHAISCVCLPQTGPLQFGVVAPSDGRFGVPAPVYSRDAVGSFIDRFRWSHPISHDWPTASHNPLVFSSHHARRDRRYPEPHLNIKPSFAQRIASANVPAEFFAFTTNTAMEFSGKDLADIQRVAGLLNLTVDELLQQSRFHSKNAASTSSPSQTSQSGDGASQQPSPEQPVPTSRPQAALNLELANFDLDNPQSSGPGSNPSEFSLPPPAAQDLGRGVILLNPHATSYDCDTAAWGVNPSAGGDFSFEDTMMDPDIAEDGSYVPVSEMEIESGSFSDYATREETQESGLDDGSAGWAIVSPFSGSPPIPTPASPSTGSPDKRYHRIAPRFPKPTARSPSDSSSNRVKKKRSPYDGRKRIDTHLTRQLHACVRCRMQRNRVRLILTEGLYYVPNLLASQCIPDPTNPSGPCLTCQQRTVRMSRLPCLRYMVTDSKLFRTGLDYMPFYRSHPMEGPHYGDFHLERQWTDAAPKFLCLGQVGAMHIKVELKEFVPPVGTKDVDLKGRPMYAVPWAVADPDAVVEAITEYIDRAITRYMAEYLDDTDPLVWNIFQAAYRASVFPLPVSAIIHNNPTAPCSNMLTVAQNEMLKKTLRLWVACRFIESKWRCWSETGWADNEFRAMNPQDPFYKDLDSLPPYIDYQIASIIIHRILGPLRKDVLRILQSTFNTHNSEDWFATFLTSFILLQNYEMQILFQRQFAKRRRAQVSRLPVRTRHAGPDGS